jgi:2Fe-2S ferredoxin
MTRIVVLPNENLCPDGAVIEAEPGESICRALLRNHIEIEHACEMSCACTTCHVIVREGYDSMEEPDELEDDYLDKAWGLEPDSRLSCQAIVDDEDLVVEIPRYTINMVSDLTLNFVDLRDWVLALPDFDDDPKHCGEKILEAIQAAWIEELD